MKSTYKYQCLDGHADAVAEGKGKNVISQPDERSLWMGFLDKFRDPIILVLLVVFLFSVAVSVYEILYAGRSWSVLIEPAGVLIALLLATGFGFLFEVRAEREFKILNKKKDERPVKVLRWAEGADKDADYPQIFQIMKCDVVEGDVVRLENGDEVPADGWILQSQSLSVDESIFTGELYATKTADAQPDHSDTTYPANFLLRGTTVIEGNCLFKVSAVGMATEEGKGALLLREEQQVRTPLNEQLDTLGDWITKASYLIAVLIVVGRLIYYFFFDGDAANNTDWLELATFALNSVMIAVTLIVVAVPEGLPMSVTISLALSMRKMLKENNLVRKLHACETMGAATVICTDKTGTLTKNKLKVMDESLVFSDRTFLAKAISVNSTAELATRSNGKPRTVGNPTEGALLYWIHRRYAVKGLHYQTLRNQFEVIEQIPFTPDTKSMTTVARETATGKVYRFIKGAPEIVLAMCDAFDGTGDRTVVETGLERLQRSGFRTLGFAFQEIVAGKATPVTFMGVVGMSDPIREDVAEAIAVCHRAGVRVIMVTGDVALTANEIARKTGIMAEDEALQRMTGPEFAAMTDEQLKREVLPELKVLSRARPADKSRLVTLLQEMGEVVAVTGDGTNDAPALKKAQVGLSMGDGTARAKEASDITILDNSFVSINTAILWGRSLYLNIKRFILFQMTINVCACLIVLVGAFTGLDSPLTVTQMLWVNLIMDTFAAIALSSLPADRKVMLDKPRNPQSHIIDRNMGKQIVVVGLLFSAILMGLWQYLWHCNSPKAHLDGYELGVFFTTFVLLQFWNLFNARYFRTSRSLFRDIHDFFRDRESFKAAFSPSFYWIAGAILVGQVLIVTFAGEMFGVDRLAFTDWLWLLLITSPILWVGEGMRLFQESSLHPRT